MAGDGAGAAGGVVTRPEAALTSLGLPRMHADVTIGVGALLRTERKRGPPGAAGRPSSLERGPPYALGRSAV